MDFGIASSSGVGLPNQAAAAALNFNFLSLLAVVLAFFSETYQSANLRISNAISDLSAAPQHDYGQNVMFNKLSPAGGSLPGVGVWTPLAA